MNAPLPALSPRRAARLASALVDWYENARRDLPWRRTRDPYAIWVSEVMLQQTRVEVVVGRWERFLKRFPDVHGLAAATLNDVLAEWAGLGYYRRARQLHAAAQQLAQQEGGRLPRSAAALRLLPGFGAYTAGAVASIAFDEAVPAVDGNVERVLARLFALSADPARGEEARAVRAYATELVRAATPHVLNQALMELGALVCVPRSPRCVECPWKRSCAARRTGAPESFPRRTPARESVEVTAYAAVLRRGRELLWRRRPEGSLNAGLWEIPTTEWHGGDADDVKARDALHELARELGVRWSIGEPLVRIRHGITHHRITVVAYEVSGEEPEAGESEWAEPDRAAALGLTAAAGKLLRRLPTLI